MPRVEPLIEVIIPNWNGEKMLADCLCSLRKQTFKEFIITVVDNGSTDGSVGLLKREFPEIKTIRFKHNTGFCVAVNSGIEQAKAPWLLLLNNDMEVAPDCLEKLSHAIKEYPDYDFYSLKMMSFHQRHYVDGAGDEVLRGGVGYRLGTMEEDGELYRHDRDSFGACAGAALYNRSFFQKTGLFDPDFFAYLEDVDLNFRANRLGLRCRFIASAIIYHIGSATSGSKINELTVRLSTRNNIFVLAKNYSPGLFFKFFPAIIIYQLMWAAFCCKHRMLRPYFAGLFQGFKSLSHFVAKRKLFLQENEVAPLKKFAGKILSSEKKAVHSLIARRSAAQKGNFWTNAYLRFFL